VGEPGLLLACGASVSGEQKASHIRGEPFMKASDFIDEETPLPKWTLDKLGKVMIDGFNETNRRIDTLAVRVEGVESAAKWKVWAIKVAKMAGPALVGAIAARFPEAAKLLGALLGAVASP